MEDDKQERQCRAQTLEKITQNNAARVELHVIKYGATKICSS